MSYVCTECAVWYKTACYPISLSDIQSKTSWAIKPASNSSIVETENGYNVQFLIIGSNLSRNKSLTRHKVAETEFVIQMYWLLQFSCKLGETTAIEPKSRTSYLCTRLQTNNPYIYLCSCQVGQDEIPIYCGLGLKKTKTRKINR